MSEKASHDEMMKTEPIHLSPGDASVPKGDLRVPGASESDVISYDWDLHNLPHKKSNLSLDITSIASEDRFSFRKTLETCNSLKRKASSLSETPYREIQDIANLEELWETRTQLGKTQIEFIELHLKLLLNEYQQGKYSDEKYLAAKTELQSNQVLCHREIKALKVMKSENFSRISRYELLDQVKFAGQTLALALTAQHREQDKLPEWLQRSKELQSAFRRDLIVLYGGNDPTRRGAIWDPVLHEWLAPGNMIAAHIIPRHLGYDQVGALFGEPNNGKGLLWDRRNGLMLSHIVEKAFDRADLVIIPTDEDGGQGRDWEVFLLNDAIKDNLCSGKLTFGDLHRRKLDFRDAQMRPRRRYLYAHYVLALFRNQRKQLPGWAEKVLQEKEESRGKMWGTCGKYFKTSSLRLLSRAVAHAADAEHLFQEPDNPNATEWTEDFQKHLANEFLVNEEQLKENTIRERGEKIKEPHSWDDGSLELAGLDSLLYE